MKMDWLDLFAVQETLKSLLQHHSLKSINSLVLSFLYSPTFISICDYWKTIALTRQTFVSKVMSLLFNMLCRLLTAFLPRSKCLLLSWLQPPSEVILEPPKNKVSHCFHSKLPAKLKSTVNEFVFRCSFTSHLFINIHNYFQMNLVITP